ncbi:hypothetical protein LINGRAHAP2_LOCUS10163 [Linum grandiflorum]
MKDTISPASAPLLPTTSSRRDSSDAAQLLGKSHYKFWVISLLLLLAFWSMLTGTVTLKWSTGNLTRLSDELDIPIHYDFDVLEVEEREKVVKHMWDVYMQSSSKRRLPRFWEQAFEAAYEALASDLPTLRDSAVSEIAKMSLFSIHLGPSFSAVQSAEQQPMKTAEPGRSSGGGGKRKKM